MTEEEILFEAEELMEKTSTFLRHELRTIRTGRASPALLDMIKVDYYGAPTALKSLANVTAPEANLLVGLLTNGRSVGRCASQTIRHGIDQRGRQGRRRRTLNAERWRFVDEIGLRLVAGRRRPLLSHTRPRIGSVRIVELFDRHHIDHDD